MLGIDIYDRYQDVTSWRAVADHGVRFCWVKGTDGSGPAVVRADGFVRGAKSVGIPVGLYHYAQLTPTPERQADVLAAEVRRLGATGLPPALDLEAPFIPSSAARAFARAFLNHLRNEHKFERVALYANTSMLNGISAVTLGVPGLVIWAANYGPNNGRRNPLPYSGADVHQYTSVGRIPGITGTVDLNESLTDISGGGGLVATPEEIKAIAIATANEVWGQHRKHLDPSNPLTLPMWMWAVGANQGAWAAAQKEMPVPDSGELAAALVEQLEPVIRETLTELDGLSPEDTERVAQSLGRKLAGPAPAGQEG